MQDLLCAVAKEKINLEYMYGLTIEKEGKASLVIKASDLEKAAAVLKKAGADLLSNEEIVSL